MAMGDGRNGGDIRNGQGGIARRLNVDEFRVGADGRLHMGGVRGVHQGGLYAELMVQQLVEQPVDGDIGHAGEDDMVPLVEQRKEQSAESRYARGQHHAVFAALQGGDPLLQIVLIGPTVAGIEIAAGAGPVHVRGVVRQSVAVGHGDGPLDGAAVPVNVVAHMDRPCGEAIFWTEGAFFHCIDPP